MVCNRLKVDTLILSIHYLYVIMGLPSQTSEIKEGDKMLEICSSKRKECKTIVKDGLINFEKRQFNFRY